MCTVVYLHNKAWLLYKRQLCFQCWIMSYILTTLLKDCLFITNFSVVDNDKCGRFQDLLIILKFTDYAETRHQHKYFE